MERLESLFNHSGTLWSWKDSIFLLRHSLLGMSESFGSQRTFYQQLGISKHWGSQEVCSFSPASVMELWGPQSCSSWSWKPRACLDSGFSLRSGVRNPSMPPNTHTQPQWESALLLAPWGACLLCRFLSAGSCTLAPGLAGDLLAFTASSLLHQSPLTMPCPPPELPSASC